MRGKTRCLGINCQLPNREFESKNVVNIRLCSKCRQNRKKYGNIRAYKIVSKREVQIIGV
jgi:hypothetical protein